MSYAAMEDVERLMAHFVISGTTKPDALQVESILNDTEQEVNVTLSAAGILTPVTGPSSFLSWLKLLVSYGATAAVLKSMFPSASGPAETPAYAFWESRYKNGLKGILDGFLVPSDVVKSGRAVKPSTYFTRNPSGEEDMGVHEPSFKRDMVF